MRTQAAGAQGAQYYSFGDSVLTFFKDKPKDIAKVFSYAASWFTIANPGHPIVERFGSRMSMVKNVLSAEELPGKFQTLNKSFSAFLNGVPGATRKVVTEVASVIHSAVDGISFFDSLSPSDKGAISEGVMRWVKGVGSVATTVFAANSAFDQVQNIRSMETLNVEGDKTMFYLLNLARDVSYLALGVISLTCMATATPLAPWVALALLTSGLTFTIGGYFYEKVYDPEKKGKNLDPRFLVSNFMKTGVAV